MSDALPVVTQWFSVTPVTAAITLIREPHADPLVRANLWHVRGRDRDLLVDCGLGITSFQDALPALVAREPVLVLTHGHFDHMGSAHEFADCRAHALEPVAEPRFGSLEGPALAASDMYPAATHQLLPPLLDQRPPVGRLRPGRLPGPPGPGQPGTGRRRPGRPRRPVLHRAAPARPQPRQHRAV